MRRVRVILILLLCSAVWGDPEGSFTNYSQTQDEQGRVYRIKLNTFAGTSVVKGEGGLMMGSQLGFAPFGKLPLYLGIESSFSLFAKENPTSMVVVLGGLWYEVSLFESSRLAGFFGLLSGIGVLNHENPVSGQLLFVPSNAVLVFVDLGISHMLDELVMLRGQFRPGVVAGNAAFMMMASVQFRF